MNKPLTKEEREQVIRRLFVSMPNERMDDFNALVSAEAYSREAVKSCNWPSIAPWCPFCSAKATPHKPDCPWLIAQD